MRHLPIGRHDFKSIREEGYLYVDKTEYIARLLDNGGRYFLSRPRRFGKSLTLTTLEAIFKGEKELFKGLWIEDKIPWTKHPVLRFSFDKITSEGSDIREMLAHQIKTLASEHGLTLQGTDIKELISELISTLAAQGERVAVLVDEYDKPILDAIPHQFELAYQRRDVLKEFFETLKSEDAHIRFIFVTGVSKFAKTTMFSGANQLNDITISPEFSALCGYTQQELEYYFHDAFPEIAKNQQISEEQLMPLIKEWYNGYNWRGKNVYNPWSILNLVYNKRIGNYWFNSGSPSFLLRYLKAGLYYKLGGMTVSETVLDSYDIEKIDYRALLFQGGYLTIAKENVQDFTYTLDFPNREVEQSLSQFMLATFAETNLSDAGMSALDIREALREGDLERFKNIVNSLFASIPAPIFLKRYEAYYHAILHTAFHLLAFYVQSEVSTSAGRADAVVTLPDRIYIFEFKINGTAHDALAQIKSRDYAGKYAASGKKIILVGVGLSKGKKGIVGMEIA